MSLHHEGRYSRGTRLVLNASGAEHAHAVHHKDVFVPRLRHEHELALHVVEYLIIAHAPGGAAPAAQAEGRVCEWQGALARADCDSPRREKACTPNRHRPLLLTRWRIQRGSAQATACGARGSDLSGDRLAAETTALVSTP